MTTATPPPENLPPFGNGDWPLLDNAGGRPEIASRVHRLLAQRPRTAVDIADYLREIAEGLVASSGIANRTELRFVGDPGCLMPQERALALGLVVGEIVANAIAFAHPAIVPGRIDIECHGHSGGAVTLTISDDGVGLPEGFDPATDGSSGLHQVRTLAARLDAEIAFRNDALGLSFHLRMQADG
jgi:two-component sensor histidine kinase